MKNYVQMDAWRVLVEVKVAGKDLDCCGRFFDSCHSADVEGSSMSLHNFHFNNNKKLVHEVQYCLKIKTYVLNF